ncbi:MAG: F0F1 ATP synthase subunit B [Armatimonadia bacterium]|nr:F0F1 ATP synthase subunit B [Armatimonadia bacterium]
MQIDWITVVAQIVNFLILLWLLKRFLYGPILQAMEDRQQRIQDQMQDAEEREAEAEEEARQHREARQELEQRRDELVHQAREEAQQRRQELVDQARVEVEALEERWHENLRDERDAFIRQLRRRMGTELCGVARRALADLANRELQAQVVSVFLQRLSDLDDQRREELRGALPDAERGPVIMSAFSLSAGQQKDLSSAVHELLDSDASVSFREADELICGVELSVGGIKAAWSLDSYLDTLEESVVEALEREAAEKREEKAEDVMPPTEVKPPEDDDE